MADCSQLSVTVALVATATQLVPPRRALGAVLAVVLVLAFVVVSSFSSTLG